MRVKEDHIKRVREIFFFLYMCALCAHATDSLFDTFLLRGSFVALGLTELYSVVWLKKWPEIKKDKFYIWYGVFSAYVLLSAIWAPSISDALSKPYLFSLVQILFLVYLLEQHCTTQEQVKKYARIILVALLYMMVYLIIRTPLDRWGTERAGFDIGLNPNDLGMRCAFGAMIAIFFAQNSPLYWLAVLVFFVGAVLSGSRKGILMLLLGCGAFMILRERGKKILRNLGVVAAVMVVVLVAIMCNDTLYQLIGFRLEYSVKGLLGLETDVSTNERAFMRQYAMEMFRQKPFFGWGSNSFMTEMRRIEYRNIAYSHNNYTELLATLGLVGLAAYYFMQVRILILGITKRIQKHTLELVLVLSVVAVNVIGEYYYVSYYSIFTQIILVLMYLMATKDSAQKQDDVRGGKRMDIMRYVKDPMKLYLTFASRGFFNWLSDETYLKLYYRAKMGKKLNLDDPKTYNEKLQWLKLHDRNPLYTELVDKYAVRRHIAEAIGEEHLIDLVGGPWNSFDEIDFDSLPEQFVLKCTHDSGGLVICRDKSKLDKAAAKEKIERSLKRNYYYVGREWPYKNVPPRIIAEAYMEDENNALGLTDYKFFCFSGEPKMVYVSQGLEDHTTARISFYDMQGNQMPFHRNDYAPLEEDPVWPENFDEMARIAGVLAKMVGSPFVRIDLYSIWRKVYFSEVTFSPCNGMLPFEPATWDEKLGQWIELPDRK